MKPEVRSLRKNWRNTSPKELQEGTDWYPSARKIVEELAFWYGVKKKVVAGIMAALSQRTMWSTNIDRTKYLLEFMEPPGGLPDAADKAMRILNGGDPEDVLGPSAFKVKAFYRALMEDDTAVVIDTWMLKAMGLSKKGYTRKQYDIMSGIITTEASKCGLKPTEYQATIWCHVRGKAE